MKKKRRSKGSAKPVRAKRGAARGTARGAGLAAVSTEALAAELKRRRSELPKLEREANALRAQLAAVEARIASLGADGTAAKPRAAEAAGKPFRAVRKGKPTLSVQLLEHLAAKGEPVSRGDIVAEVARRMGREVSPSFSVQVSATLRKLVNAGEAAQVGRGQYAAKGVGIAAS
ncbi:MAG: hypothetical protein LW636_06315 [Planctomycetaceae bacterium]|jgi:hypothetical protein|nr:hypothetical protein [Planctomycetaceae bacterium]